MNGDGLFGHNLVVKGWLDAPNIKGPLKGLYASEEKLNEAYPRPMPGWFALVGKTLPADVYRVDEGKWVATGEKGGQFTLYLDQLETDVKNLTDDVRDLEELLDNGLLLGETITFTSTGTAAAMTFTVMKRDGSTKEHSKAIPIVSADKAGMMTAADKKELTTATAAIATLNGKISTLETTTAALAKTCADLRTALEDSQAGISALEKRFDALIGENASEAIDNFTEVLAFLDGLKDTEKLSTKLADLSGMDAKQAGEILELQQSVWPLTVELTATPKLIKAGIATNVHLAWKAERKGREVTAEAAVTLDGAETAGKSKDISLTLGHGETRESTLTASFEGLTESASVTIRGTHPSYFGSVAKTWEGTEANIKALAEIIAGERTLTRNGIATSDGKIALAYPKDFGALTSVKDGNGYEVLSSYTRSETSVNGIQYYLYLLTVPVTASGVTQIYK